MVPPAYNSLIPPLTTLCFYTNYQKSTFFYGLLPVFLPFSPSHQLSSSFPALRYLTTNTSGSLPFLHSPCLSKLQLLPKISACQLDRTQLQCELWHTQADRLLKAQHFFRDSSQNFSSPSSLMKTDNLNMFKTSASSTEFNRKRMTGSRIRAQDLKIRKQIGFKLQEQVEPIRSPVT